MPSASDADGGTCVRSSPNGEFELGLYTILSLGLTRVYFRSPPPLRRVYIYVYICMDIHIWIGFTRARPTSSFDQLVVSACVYPPPLPRPTITPTPPNPTHPGLGFHTILPLPILDGVYFNNGGSGGNITLRNSVGDDGMGWSA